MENIDKTFKLIADAAFARASGQNWVPYSVTPQELFEALSASAFLNAHAFLSGSPSLTEGDIIFSQHHIDTTEWVKALKLALTLRVLRKTYSLNREEDERLATSEKKLDTAILKKE